MRYLRPFMDGFTSVGVMQEGSQKWINVIGGSRYHTTTIFCFLEDKKKCPE